MQVSRRDVKLQDVEIARGRQGKEYTERLESHDWGEGLAVIDAGSLVVTTRDDTGLVLVRS